jgi:hypothetical protein
MKFQRQLVYIQGVIPALYYKKKQMPLVSPI